MELINFDEYSQNDTMYGGTAGRKIGIFYQGSNYIVKYPGNLKEQKMKNIVMSYSNSPVCEYIGSQIYSMLGIPSHDTILGIRNNKVVVACKDFLAEGEKLYEFDKIKVTFEPRFFDSNGNETNGNGVDLYEIIMTIREHPFFKDMVNIERHFWDMFIIDAFIGNTDRNNSNWGIIISEDGMKRIAPVYDNGNCLNCKWDDEKMQLILENEKLLETEAYKGRRCIFEMEGKKINPYYFIEKQQYSECMESVKRLVPAIALSMNKIQDMICEIPVISDIQKRYYQTIIRTRYEKILCPAFEKLCNRGYDYHEDSYLDEER